MIRPAQNAAEALAHVAAGGRACVRTYSRVTLITPKVLKSFEAAGEWLLKDDGNGIRLRSGRGSVYLLPGQLELIVE